MPRTKWTTELVTAELKLRHATPQPGWIYVDARTPIPITCDICKRNCDRQLMVIMRGPGACRHCGRERSHAQKRSDPTTIKRRLIEEIFWLPDEPFVYKNAITRIPGTCLVCGEWSEGPQWGSVRNGKQGACYRCGVERRREAQRLTQAEYWERCDRYDWVPTPGHFFKAATDKVPGHCKKCEQSGEVWFTNLGKAGACSGCADYGLDYTKPTYLYLVTHIELEAVKVGITNVETKPYNRINQYTKSEWQINQIVRYETGHEAKAEEKRILAIWRSTNFPRWLTQEQMPNKGAYETAHIDALALIMPLPVAA